jgi:uncharacterized phage protein (TIGR01671 family)
MREIKFRGLDINGVWRYGNLLQSSKFKDGRVDCWIQSKSLLCVGAASVSAQSFTQVDEKTVGQFAGLTSKNGKDIYEDDIVNKGIIICEVIFSVKAAKFCVRMPSHQWHGVVNKVYSILGCEIIGNIHQNPELLEQ